MKNNDISYDDLCNLIANEVPTHKASPHSAHTYLRALYKVILRQLELNQRITIKNFGTFEIKERKSGERLINNPKNNQKQIYYVKPRYSISFKASSNFDYSVNENNFIIVSDERNKTLNRESRKVPIRKKTEHITDLLNIANKRKEKGLDENGKECLHGTESN